MKKIAYLGAGTWGFSLSSLLARNGHQVVVWSRDAALVEELQKNRTHPRLVGSPCPDHILFTTDLDRALEGAEVIVESITTSGIRPVFQEVLKRGPLNIPVIITSKGIEQGTGKLLPEVISELLAQESSSLVGCISGPSLADDVVNNKPISVVCSAYDPHMMPLLHMLFTTPTFRVYPNSDINGVCFGGAMKNIIAIACGIADGLGCGDSAKAALMTRGLHEIRKLCVTKRCKPETLNGLSGLGDLCATCISTKSRNYRYGRLIAEGLSPEGARQKIGMAIEGMYSCVSALQLGRKFSVPVPITEVTYSIIYEGLRLTEAMQALLQRSIKEEHL